MSAATNSTPAVELIDVAKRYGDATALAGLDLSVPAGGCFGLLGPNGAGKTTCVGILTTLVRPSRGVARVLGHDVVAEPAAVRARIGLVFQEPSLDLELTPRETLDLTARLYRVPQRRARVDEMLALVALGACADRVARALSGGQRRRLELARGLLHRPQVLFLDEPTQGLDVAARAAIWEHVRALGAGGTSVFLTTHSMEEDDALCARLAILDGGCVVAEGAPAELKAALGGDVVSLELERAEGAVERLRSVAGVRSVAAGADGRLHVTLRDGPRRVAALVEAAAEHGILEVNLSRPSLEAVFLHHTGHAFGAAEAATAAPERA